MSDITSIIDEIRAALEKVQNNEWFMSSWHVEEDASAVRNSNDFSFIANTSSDSFAAFIATVNPPAIRALLDHIAAQAEEIERLREENGQLIDENTELRYEPWPEWAKAVLKVIRSHTGYDGYDDATEGVDMPLGLSEHLAEMEAANNRATARAEAAEARVRELEGALKEAREMVAHWGAYASEYFQDKHDLRGDLGELDAVLTGEKP